MIICVCNNINDKTIRKKVQGGSRTLSALQKHLDIADQCSACVQYTCKIISDESNNRNIRPHHLMQPALSSN